MAVWILSGFCAMGLFLGISTFVFRRELAVENRVLQLTASTEEQRSWEAFRSWGTVLADRFFALVTHVTPAGARKAAELQVRAAGMRHPQAVRHFLMGRAGLRLSTGAGAVLLLLARPSVSTLLFSVGIALVGILVPRVYIARKIKAAQEQTRRTMPHLIDMLTISVEAGLGFDQALARTTKHMQNALGAELRQTIAEMGLGKSRREALRDAVERVAVDEFRSFVSAVVQADRLGMGIANVLRIQAEEARRKLRQQAEERAMKAPIKILFPLVFFLFPGLFIIILGPAALRIVHYFIG